MAISGNAFPFGLREIKIIRYGTPADEVQSVTITGAPDGGTFTLTYAGQTTAGIAYNAAAAAVDAALEALSNIGAGDVAVTGSAGGPYTVTFGGALAGIDVALMTASGASLTGGTDPDVVVALVTAGDPLDYVILPAAQTLKFMERVTTAELRGNDRVVVASSHVDAVEWELSNGGIPMDGYAIMTGRTLATAGSGANETTTMTIAAGDTFPWFTLYGRSIGDDADDVHVKLWKCKLTGGMDGTLSDQNFYVAGLKGIAIDDGSNGIADVVRNETAVAL